MPKSYVVEPERKIEVSHEADVVVCGGGTAGVAAAVTAGRMGLKTVMVERSGMPGGMVTHHIYGIQDCGMKGGFVREFMGFVEKQGLCETRYPRRGHTYNRFSVPFYLDELLDDAGVQPIYLSMAVSPLLNDNRLEGVIIESKSGRTAVCAPVVVDATGDGDIAVRAGAGYNMGRAGDGACQSMSMAAVFFEYNGEVIPDKKVFGDMLAEAERSAGGSFKLDSTYRRLIPLPCAETTTQIGVSVHGYDATDADSLSLALIELRRRMRDYNAFLSNEMEPFRNAVLGPVSAIPGVRESRRIICDDSVTREDVMSGRRREDGLFTVTQSIDIHRRVSDDPDIILEKVQPYHLPYGAMLPRGLENLLVAGRCIGGEHESLGSYRIAADCFAMGEAAGIAASLALERSCTVREIPGEDMASEMKARDYVM